MGQDLQSSRKVLGARPVILQAKDVGHVFWGQCLALQQLTNKLAEDLIGSGQREHRTQMGPTMDVRSVMPRGREASMPSPV